MFLGLFQRMVACFSMMSLVASPTVAMGQTAPQAAAASAPATKPAPAPDATVDAGWPRRIVKNGINLVYYQPQVDSWDNYRLVKARMAFSLTPSGKSQVLGVVSVEAGTTVDQSSRTVYLHDLKYTSVRFSSVSSEGQAQLEKDFRATAPADGEPISLDRLIADVDKGKEQVSAPTLKNDPPQIFYSVSPAILLLVQGTPVLSPIEKTDLQFVVNTNWDLFFEKSKGDYFLLAENQWLTSKNPAGPWTATKTLPKDMAKLPAGQNFDDVKRYVPAPATAVAAPHVFYSQQPAELLLLRGAPVYTRVAGTRLLYVSNTDNDIFLNDASKQFYILLSGRWFSSSSMQGPWTYASANLPTDFTKIPESSAKARVLSSVPGTVEASDAVLLAQVPTTVVVNRAEAEAKAKVTYDGSPKFSPIEKTKLEYATNTQDKVIKDGDIYYLCFQGVWFMSSAPNGPWKTVSSVPQEIYSIPSSSPVYNVTYVTQTNATATTVESSTTAGYFGMFIVGAAVGAAIVYGSGWYYPPYVYWGPGAFYPVYRPWPATYGAGVVYNPWNGGWAAGRGVYGPYGAAGSSAWYNPATGRYGRSASVQGWYGGRTVASAYNPWTGGYGATSQGHNAYAQWGSSVATRNDNTIQTGHVTTANGTIAGYRTSNGQHGTVYHGDNGTVVHGANNSVYAGNDGNVYRHDANGGWSQYSNGNWNTVDTSAAKQKVDANHPNASTARQNGAGKTLSGATKAGSGINSGTLQGLDRSNSARERGQRESGRFQNFRRGGGRFRR
ncbi:hypothetical protein [Terracidiphilus gabretensis]|uniref:hypothetical protein n=1 Tax=Terracidiphilus gabretensis TaxID=1577687 RepID=UPI00071C0A9F|nr:hypothetical protein [Terracidiphilus gabretensis]